MCDNVVIYRNINGESVWLLQFGFYFNCRYSQFITGVGKVKPRLKEH